MIQENKQQQQEQQDSAELTMALIDILEIVDNPSKKMDIIISKAKFIRSSLLSLRNNLKQIILPIKAESEEQIKQLESKTMLLQRWRETLSNLM